MWPFKKKRTEPAYGDIRVVKILNKIGLYVYETQSFTKSCFGDGDEWYEWEMKYTSDEYTHALKMMDVLVREKEIKDFTPIVMDYTWNGGR